MAIIPQGQPAPLAPPIEEENANGMLHCTIDIETMDAPRTGIELAKRFWKPNPKWVKQDVIDKAREEAGERFKEKAALLDSAPVAVVGIRTESEEVIFYCAKPKKKFTKIKGMPTAVYQYKNERELLTGLRTWLDKRALPITIVIGHNIFGFDLPKIRGAYVRHRLAFPKVLHPDARDVGVRIYDTMKRFCNFSSERSQERYTSLEEMLARFDIPSHKNGLRGADVPRYLAEGRVQEVAAYCILDVIGTYSAFLYMTGQYVDGK